MSAVRRRYHPVVWWVIGLHLLFTLTYVVLVPTYRGPDEAAHVDMIRQYRDGPLVPDPTVQVPSTPGVAASVAIMGPPGTPRPPQTVADATARDERPSFATLDGSGATGRVNQMTQHPPLYYLAQAGVASVVDALPGGPISWDTEVLLYRLVSVLIAALLPLVAAEGALAIGLGRAGSAVAAAVTLCVPMASFIGAVVNNDTLVMVAGGAAAVGALGFARRGGWGYALLTAAGCAVAPLTKSTGAPVVVWAVLVIAVGLVWGGTPRRAAPLALVAGGVVVGASWHVHNLLRYRDPQPNGFSPSDPSERADTGVLEFVPDWATRINASFWGQPGRNTGVTLPDATFWLLVLAAAVVLAVALVRGTPRWPVLALGGLVLTTALVLFRTNYRAHLRSGAYPALQGRYLFPVLVPLVLLLAVGVLVLCRRRAGTAVTAAVAIAAVGVVEHVVLGWSMLTAGYWDDAGDGFGGFVDSMVAWSALPEALTLSVFGLTALAVLAGAVAAGITAAGASAGRPWTNQPERRAGADHRVAERT